MIAALAAALAASATTGALLVIRGLFPPPIGPAAAAAVAAGGKPPDRRTAWLDRLHIWERAALSGGGGSRTDHHRGLAADLAILELSGEWWRSRLSIVSVGAGVTSTGLLGALAVGLGAAPRPEAAALAVVGCVLASRLAAGWRLKSRAAARRSQWRHAVAVFLELAAVALAGGAGPAEATRTAALLGGGPVFRRVQTAMAGADVYQRSPYDALEVLGTTVAVPELQEFGAAMSLAEQRGAPVRTTLDAKAATTVHRLATVEEAAAEARSVAMSLPSVLMVMGFLLFLMYPFVAALVATTG